jgi:hypothetical protein
MEREGMTTCSNGDCGAPVHVKHCQLCLRCYHRWSRNFFRVNPDETPDVPVAHRKQLLDDARYATFKELVDEGHGERTRWLGEQLGVSRRTIVRYRARLREELTRATTT